MDFPWEVLKEALETGSGYLSRLRSGVARAGSLFQDGHEGEGIRLFRELLDGLEWLATLVNSVEFLLRQDLLKLPCNGELEEAAASFRNVLRELQVAWENADYVLIGDLLTYEFTPLVAWWEEIVAATAAGCLPQNPRFG